MAQPRSNRPASVRRRLRNNSKQMSEDVNALFPQKPISEWDLEELERGKPRDENGKFRTGAKPPWVDPIMQIEINKRLKEMTSVRVQAYASRAIGTIVELMQMSNVDMVRMQSAQYILNQIIGMPTQRTELQAEVNVQAFLADVLVNPDAREQKVIEGEFYVDDEEDDDPSDSGD